MAGDKINEELLAYSCLLTVGFLPDSMYIEYLNTRFNESPENDLLLELEWCSSDIWHTIAIISAYCKNRDIDYSMFGSFLIKKLKDVYYQTDMSLQTFSSKATALWGAIPPCLQEIEPFFTMCYADEPLSWGDEQQTKILYEKMLDFYNNNEH